MCMIPNYTEIICSCHSYLGMQNTIFVPSVTLLWGTRHDPYLLYLLLFPGVSSLGEDGFPGVLPPAHARGLLALAEEPASAESMAWEGAVGFRSLGLYGITRGSCKCPSAATVWSPPGQVTPCPVKRQDTVIKSPGLQSMIFQAERQNLCVQFSIFQQIASVLFYP